MEAIYKDIWRGRETMVWFECCFILLWNFQNKRSREVASSIVCLNYNSLLVTFLSVHVLCWMLLCLLHFSSLFRTIYLILLDFHTHIFINVPRLVFYDILFIVFQNVWEIFLYRIFCKKKLSYFFRKVNPHRKLIP